MIFPLFKHWFYTLTKKVSKHSMSSKAATYPLDSVGIDGGSKQTRDSSSYRSGKKNSRSFRHPLSLSRNENWGSEEGIITIEEDDPATEIEDGMCRTDLHTVHKISASECAEDQNRMTSSNSITTTKTWDIERADQWNEAITPLGCH